MKCPFCKNKDTKVTDSRDTDDGTSIRRRRQCLTCKKRFTTYESIESTPVRVIKKDGTRELFDKNKIRNGLIRACEKRNISTEQIEQVVEKIEIKVYNALKQEIYTETIGNLIMEELKELDQVSYVRFASVYREFKDLESFMSELRMLMRKESNENGLDKEVKENKKL